MRIYTCSSVGIDYFFFLGKTLRQSGFSVEEIYLITEENYRALAKSKGLKKVLLRFNMYISYPLLLILKSMLAPGQSVFIVSSNTFYAPLVVRLFSFGRVKIINLIYDLFPDAIEMSGKLKQNSWSARAIGKLIKATLKLSHATIYLGDFLAAHANKRWWKPSLYKRIDISADYSLFDSVLSVPDNSPIVLHYGGQLGHLHDATALIQSLKSIEDINQMGKVSCNFYVSGAQAAYIEQELGSTSVKVKTAIASHEWRKDIRNFHVGLVSLTPGGAAVCLPSKTYSMMGGGLAIIAICPQWSDLAHLIIDLEAGWVINNSPYNTRDEIETQPDYMKALFEKRDYDDIAHEFKELVQRIIATPDLIHKKRKNAFHGVRNKFGIELLAADWRHVIEEVTSRNNN